MPTYSLEIKNPDGSVQHLGVILGVTGDEAKTAARARITRRQAELDETGEVVLRAKDTNALLYETKGPTVAEMIDI